MAIKEELIAKLQYLNISRIVVFDDDVANLTLEWFMDDDVWQGLFNALEAQLEDVLGIPEVNRLRRLPAEERRNEVDKIIIAVPEAIVAQEVGPGRALILQQWLEAFDELELTVERFANWEQFVTQATQQEREARDLLKDFQLILLDYDFGPELGDGHSEQIARTVSELLNVRDGSDSNPVPILIKFSAHSIEQTPEEKRAFTKRVRFPLGCYEFIPKRTINEDFYDRLMAIIQVAEVGRLLYELSRNIASTIRETAANKVLDVLIELDPESVRVLSEELLPSEGVTAYDYFTSLFIGLLHTTLASSEQIMQTTRAYLESITANPVPPDVFQPRGLQRLQNKLLFDYTVNTFHRPIDFGDIFIFGTPDNNNRVGILLTQSCDMAVRLSRKKGEVKEPETNTERLLLLTGDVIKPTPHLKGETVTRWFTFQSDNEATLAIKWLLDNPVILPRPVLDLTSLDSNGAAILHREDPPPSSEWWTDTYADYISRVRDYLKANCMVVSPDTSGAEPEGRQIIIPTDKMATDTVFHALGSAALYLVKEEDDKWLFPIRRVARLRLIDSLYLQQRYLSHAGRMGIQAELHHHHETISVQIKNKNGQLIGGLGADRHAVEGKKWEAILVNNAEFERVCKGHESFRALVSFSKNYGDYFDLQKGVHSDKRYTLKKKQEGEWILTSTHL